MGDRGLRGGFGSAGSRQSTAVAPRGSPGATLVPRRLPKTGLGTGAGGRGHPGSPSSIPVLPNDVGSAEEERREDFCLKRQKRAASGQW